MRRCERCQDVLGKVHGEGQAAVDAEVEAAGILVRGGALADAEGTEDAMLAAAADPTMARD